MQTTNTVYRGLKKTLLLVSFVISLTTGIAQHITLPESSPEQQGVSSTAIADFFDAVSASKNELHGFVMIRHGKVIAKAWAAPYADTLKHTLYSTSKSFTATAVGFAVAEKKITVDDNVIKFFPELLPDTISPNLRSLKIRHLLTMTVGHASDPSGPIGTGKHWVKSFLATPIVDTPGTKFLYNSMATFMLSAIVQKVTSQRIIDYLEPRLFAPLGIEKKDWEVNPEGINVGGWGLRLSTMDIAKFGQLFLQKGKWQGKQLIPASWVAEASKAHIIQNPSATAAERASSDWLQGYGYQFWRSRNNSYRADGAFGQYILIFPELDAVIAINSETPSMQDEINLIWKHIYPAIKPAALPQNTSGQQRLATAAKKLKVDPFKQMPDSVIAVNPQWSSRTVNLRENQHGFRDLQFNLEQNGMKVKISTDSGVFNLPFGTQNWQSDTTGLYGPALTERMTNSMKGIGPVRIAGTYRWKTPQTPELILQYIESPHREIWTCYFDGSGFRMEIRNSIAIMKEDVIEETLTGSVK